MSEGTIADIVKFCKVAAFEKATALTAFLAVLKLKIVRQPLFTVRAPLLIYFCRLDRPLTTKGIYPKQW